MNSHQNTSYSDNNTDDDAESLLDIDTKSTSHQEIILINLSFYLSLSYETIFGKDNIPEEYKQILELLKSGHCFGFSVIHAAMDIIKKLPWWEFVLVCIETWNKDPDLLSNNISTIPDLEKFIPPAITAQDREILLKTNLATLFKRAANYIFSYHGANTTSPFNPQHLESTTILKPAKKGICLFDITDANGNTFFIQDRQFPAIGHLTVEDFDAILSDDLPEICLVNSMDHVIRIGKHENEWFVYDPNYMRWNKEVHECSPYIRYFSTKKEAIEEIIFIQGYDVVIEMASTSHAVTPTLTLDTKEKVEEFVDKNLSDKFFYLSAHYVPHVFIQLINYMSMYEKTPHAQVLRKRLAEGLLVQDSDDWTAFHVMCRYAPNIVLALIHYITNHSPSDKKIRQIKKALAKALIIQRNDGCTGLAILGLVPDALISLMEYIDKDISFRGKNLQSKFAYALQIETRGYPGLNSIPLTSLTVRFIIKNAPRSIPQLLTRIQDENEFLDQDAGLQNGLTLREQIIADAIRMTHNDLMTKEIRQIILMELGGKLTDQSIHRIANSFSNLLVNRFIKNSIYRELAIIELTKSVPNSHFISTTLSLGKEVWGGEINVFPYVNREGKDFYLSLPEQALVNAYLTGNSNLVKDVFLALKKEDMTIDITTIKKISATFLFPENEKIIKWLNENLSILNQENLNSKRGADEFNNKQFLPSKRFRPTIIFHHNDQSLNLENKESDDNITVLGKKRAAPF